jgi:hypothetical protein
MSFCSHRTVQFGSWKALLSCQFSISVDVSIVRFIDRCILGLNRRIDVCAEMSRHCKHSSTAKTCASIAYLLLACGKRHELLNHEASQRNYRACLSAAGDEAEFMCSAFADVKMLQLLPGTKHYQNDIVRCVPESQDNCNSGDMPPMATGAQVAPPHGCRQTSI